MIMNSNSVEKKLTKKDLKQVFVRSIAYNSSFNYERQLNLGWAFSLMPVLRKLYKDDEEQMKAALARHLEFNNITPFICTVLFGILRRWKNTMRMIGTLILNPSMLLR